MQEDRTWQAKLVTAGMNWNDAERLKPSSWLNDEIVNFYGMMISERARKAEQAGDQAFLKVHVFNSFFYATLRNKRYAGVQRWTKKVRLVFFVFARTRSHLSSVEPEGGRVQEGRNPYPD